MTFVVTYQDKNGTPRTQTLNAEDEADVRRKLRRNGISPTNTTISRYKPTYGELKPAEEEIPNQIPSEPGFWETANAQAEQIERERQAAQDPKNFHKILTNDDSPKENQDCIQYEYKHLRLDYKGRGITQELHVLDIDGVRVTGWFTGENVPTLPEIFQMLGKSGWQMIGHNINQDLQQNGITFHYYNFMRAKRFGHKDRDFIAPKENKNLLSSAIESFGA